MKEVLISSISEQNSVQQAGDLSGVLKGVFSLEGVGTSVMLAPPPAEEGLPHCSRVATPPAERGEHGLSAEGTRSVSGIWNNLFPFHVDLGLP